MLQRSPETRRLWRDEIRATLALAWPLILTNIAQALIHVTDVVLLGWAGPSVLAAGTLGVNVYFAFLIFGIGLVTATAPMIAKELGERRHSVRDVRRTVRQGMWAAVALTLPVWAVLWFSGSILVAIGQDPALAADAQTVRPGAAMGLPSLSLVSGAPLVHLGAREAALVVHRRGGRRAVQRDRQLRPDLRPFRLSQAGAGRRRHGQRDGEHADVRGHGAGRPDPRTIPSLSPVRPFLAVGLAALPRSLAARAADRGDPGAGDHHLQRGRLPDGPDRRRVRSPPTPSPSSSRR